jgi:hypothetical protein
MAELLDSLDRLPKIRQFDAFPKTQSIYTQRSSKGGVLTIISALALVFLLWTELSTYLYGERGYSFAVDSQLQSTMQINMDMTVAMKCHYLTIDVRDAVGDRLHVSDTEFKKDGTTFDIGHADRLDALPQEALDVGKTISKARKKPLYRRKPRNKKFSRQVAFHKTAHLVPDGPACRIYGSMEVKRVTGNLHITTLGHGYLSMEHTDHKLMNLSHVIHEFSFGPYFPEISQPLDSSVETTDKRTFPLCACAWMESDCRADISFFLSWLCCGAHRLYSVPVLCVGHTDAVHRRARAAVAHASVLGDRLCAPHRARQRRTGHLYQVRH